MKVNSIQNLPVSSHSKHKSIDGYVTKTRPNFGEDKKTQEEDQASGISVKKITNYLGVLAWLGVAGLGIYKTGMFRKKTAENVYFKAKDLSSKYGNMAKNAASNDAESLKESMDNYKGVRGWFAKKMYKAGIKSNGLKDKLGPELYNNATYAFGTMFVMPLVIWTSPFGKKDSTNSDKAYATLRQPFSVFATFTLQAIFDKMFDRYTPRIVKSNVFEKKGIVDEKDETKILAEKYNDIKYNNDEAKRIFKDVLPDMDVEKGGLKGIIDKETAKELVTLDQFADAGSGDSYRKILTNMKENGKFEKLTEENLKILSDKVKVLADSVDYNSLMKQRPKIINNVIVSSVIGCTFLNVIYGKFMKAAVKHQQDLSQKKAEVK
jgi:hypothetical protein